MKNHFAFTLLAAALVGPELSAAPGSCATLWAEQSRAGPSDWNPVEKSRNVGKSRFLQDTSGAVVSIPVATLERPSAEKRLFRPDLAHKGKPRSDRIGRRFLLSRAANTA